MSLSAFIRVRTRRAAAGIDALWDLDPQERLVSFLYDFERPAVLGRAEDDVVAFLGVLISRDG